jgi:hypothetical protein
MKTQKSWAEFYRDFLRDEGFRPNIDDNGHVVFKFESGSYMICIDSDDEQFFQLIYLFGFEIESQEEFHRAMNACVNITRDTKVVKLSVIKDELSSFVASVEAFVDSPEAVTKKVFDRYLSVIQDCVGKFVKHMRES